MLRESSTGQRGLKSQNVVKKSVAEAVPAPKKSGGAEKTEELAPMARELEKIGESEKVGELGGGGAGRTGEPVLAVRKPEKIRES